MTKASQRKAKRGCARVVMYVRVKREEHELIMQIADKRGYPHTISSVVAEMIARCLKDETAEAATEVRS